MKKLLATTATLLLCGSALASGPECTTEARSAWMPEEDFKVQAKLLGYDADTLQTSEGNCYTLTALDAADATDVDYFDPMTGQLIPEQ